MTDELAPPVREQVASHRCRCVLTDVGQGIENHCPVQVASPDQPFCDECEEVHWSGKYTFAPGVEAKVWTG